MSSSSAPSSSEPAAAADAAAAPGEGRASSLIAGDDWQAIEFVSDLHLSPDTPRTRFVIDSQDARMQNGIRKVVRMTNSIDMPSTPRW